MQDDRIPGLPAVCRLAQQTGEKILAIYRAADQGEIEIKKNGTPLTEADRISHNTIVAGLTELTPNIPILSEESTDIPFTERAAWSRYWLVDPLDGTKEFIERTDDFTVNIALIEGHRVVLGVVYEPVSGYLYSAAHNQGAFKQSLKHPSHAIHVRPWAKDGIVRVLTSRRHGTHKLQPLLDKFPSYTLLERGSSLKFCLVAEGRVDIYPRLGSTSEWDTAAAQCIVEQAGGIVIDCQDGLPLQYNTRDSLQNPHFLVIGDKTCDWRRYL